MSDWNPHKHVILTHRESCLIRAALSAFKPVIQKHLDETIEADWIVPLDGARANLVALDDLKERLK